jgi:hypothetical protein
MWIADLANNGLEATAEAAPQAHVRIEAYEIIPSATPPGKNHVPDAARPAARDSRTAHLWPLMQHALTRRIAPSGVLRRDS